MWKSTQKCTGLNKIFTIKSEFGKNQVGLLKKIRLKLARLNCAFIRNF